MGGGAGLWGGAGGLGPDVKMSSNPEAGSGGSHTSSWGAGPGSVPPRRVGKANLVPQAGAEVPSFLPSFLSHCPLQRVSEVPPEGSRGLFDEVGGGLECQLHSF